MLGHGPPFGVPALGRQMFRCVNGLRRRAVYVIGHGCVVYHLCPHHHDEAEACQEGQEG